MTTDDINIIALVKGDERYIFAWHDSQRDELLNRFGRFADDPDLSFSWYDAGVLSSKIRASENMGRGV